MAEDIKENAMAGGTPARLRGLAANGNSISPTLEEVASAMPVATMEEKGMASAGQGRVEYSRGRQCRYSSSLLWNISICQRGT